MIFRLQIRLMEGWREKCSILKSGMDAADGKIAAGKTAEGEEEIESCYRMLKVRENAIYAAVQQTHKLLA